MEKTNTIYLSKGGAQILEFEFEIDAELLDSSAMYLTIRDKNNNIKLKKQIPYDTKQIVLASSETELLDIGRSWYDISIVKNDNVYPQCLPSEVNVTELIYG